MIITMTALSMGILTVLQNTTAFSFPTYTKGDKERSIRLIHPQAGRSLGSTYLCPHLGVEFTLLRGDHWVHFSGCREGRGAGRFFSRAGPGFTVGGIRDGEVTKDCYCPTAQGAATFPNPRDRENPGSPGGKILYPSAPRLGGGGTGRLPLPDLISRFWWERSTVLNRKKQRCSSSCTGFC